MRTSASTRTAVATRMGADYGTEQAQRLEAIGRLTGGVAHDFNNLLTVIIGVTEALAAGFDDGSEQQELALTGMRAAERGADLVRRLLAPSGDDGARAQAIDGAEVLEEVASLARQAIRGDVRLEVSEPAYPVCCIADRTDLGATLMNLCVNARDAMPFGGTLSLGVDHVLLASGAAEALDLRAGPYVVFTVRDNGVGMSPATLAQATQPFFTTKGDAGTGLGLANCQAFARRSDGRLAISSREGEGTTVSLYLPAARAARRARSTADIIRLEARHAR